MKAVLSITRRTFVYVCLIRFDETRSSANTYTVTWSLLPPPSGTNPSATKVARWAHKPVTKAVRHLGCSEHD